MSADSYYPPVAFYFNVIVVGIKGANEGNFQEVTGLGFKMETTPIIEGGENRFVHRFPVPAKYDNLVLKRGMLVGSPLIDWAKDAIEQFTFKPTTVVVSLMDLKASVAVWKFINAYPVGLKFSELKAQDNAIMLETLELSYDYYNKVK
jgi:phage tail-like protein